MSGGRAALPVLAALALLAPAASRGAEPKGGEAGVRDGDQVRLRDRIARLVRQLGDDDYRRREAAGDELAEIGDDALPALYAARKSPDPEIAERAATLVGKLESDTRRLEARSGWEPAGWDNPAGVSAERDEQAGRHCLVLKLAGGGAHAKSTVKLGLEGEIREEAARAARLSLRVRHDGDGPVPVSAAFLSDVGGETVYFESPARGVPAGEWKTLSFDLAAADFKSEATGWEYRSKLGGRDAIRSVMVVVDANRPLNVRLTGMRFRK